MARSIQCGLGAIPFLLRLLFQGRLEALAYMGLRYPEWGRIRIGTRTGVLLNTPELVEQVLVHRAAEFQKSPALRIYSRPLLGNGLLTSEGAEHLANRRLVAPAFAHARVPQYAETMTACAVAAVDAWPQEGVLDIHREMTRLTLDIVGLTLFGVNLLDDADSIGRDITSLIQFATRQTRSLRPHAFDHGRRRARAQAATDRLNRTLFDMIERRRAMAQDTGDVLSMLLSAHDENAERLSDEQVRDEAMTLFVAGHETTANGVTWALYLLARHPEVQRALGNEVHTVLGDRPATYADLARLPLALQVFKEALRLFPPAYIVVREALDDIELAPGLRVRRGELVALCEYILHRNPRYFDEPTRFDPERFTPENEAKIPRYSYFPFGAGRRICIGNQFALMEGQIVLATLAQRASFAPISNRALRGDPLMTLRPRGPARLRVTKY